MKRPLATRGCRPSTESYTAGKLISAVAMDAKTTQDEGHSGDALGGLPAGEQQVCFRIGQSQDAIAISQSGPVID
jgi:hypothetical protein